MTESGAAAPAKSGVQRPLRIVELIALTHSTHMNLCLMDWFWARMAQLCAETTLGEGIESFDAIRALARDLRDEPNRALFIAVVDLIDSCRSGVRVMSELPHASPATGVTLDFPASVTIRELIRLSQDTHMNSCLVLWFWTRVGERLADATLSYNIAGLDGIRALALDLWDEPDQVLFLKIVELLRVCRPAVRQMDELPATS